MTHNKYKNLIIIASIALILIAIVYLIKRPSPIEVQLTSVEKGIVESIITNTRAGTVKACRQAELSPAIGGQISTLPVSKGDVVEKDTILIELWNEDTAARVALAKRESTAAKAHAEEACTIAEVAKKEAKRFQEIAYQSKRGDNS